MMSEKRFTIVGEEYVGYTQGNAYIISNGECKFSLWESKEDAQKVCDCLNEQQSTIQSLKEDKEIAEDYANIFEKENVKLRKKLNNYKATVLGFIWMMEQNGRISGKDDKVVKDLFKELENE